MRKKILVICMCLTLVFAITAQDIKEVKAFAPAVPVVLAVGAVALGAGIYFYNKDDLEVMTNDCLDWMKENVFDAYSELIELTENGGKILISTAITQGILSYLKHKFGWGNSENAIRDMNMSIEVGAKFQDVYNYINSAPDKYISDGIPDFISYASTEGVSVYYGVDPSNSFCNYFAIWENDITDIYLDYTDYNYYLVYSDGTISRFDKRKDGSSRVDDVVRSYVYPDLSKRQEMGNLSIWTNPESGAIEFTFRDFFVYSSDINRTNVANNSFAFPDGVKVWKNKDAYLKQDIDSLDFYGITGQYEIFDTVSIGSNAELQDEEKVVTVPTIGSMTIDEFINATKDLAIDDTPAWINLIDKIIATDTDVDVPTDTPSEDTKPSVPPLVSDFTADLTSLFPFCLPFDLIDLVKALSVEPVAPKWEIPIKFKYGAVVDYKQTFVLDMKDYESVVKIFRTLETIGFIVGLIMITRNQMIKG